ncbi:MAG: hypothetical protein JNN07_11625 [Verrucomicrobiales bacterium]|nr:hypothetical protein [Verrucomicrobiales bacterium]
MTIEAKYKAKKWQHVAFWLLLAVCSGRVWAFDQLNVEIVGDQLRIHHSGNTNFYHVLLRGDQPQAVHTPVSIHGPKVGEELFSVTIEPGQPTRFFQVHRYPVEVPADQDQDSMNDVYELRYPVTLNPLNPADATADADGDGLINREEARRGSDPSLINPGTVLETAPAAQEAGVAVTRETIIRLTQPLAANATLTTARLNATAAGRSILSRPNLSLDRRTITLFYLENLPANESVTVTLNGNGLKLSSGQDLDANGDGQPGGVLTLVFQTLGIAADLNTGISGVVYDSERINQTNRPLAGVTITVDGAEETLRAITDERGRFTLSPCPTGRFFVHIDGRTADLSSWPNGDYYPFIGKAWTAIQGSHDNLATPTGEIFLPRIRQGSLRSVSSVSETKVGFPSSVVAANPTLAGVSITIPPNSLFADNGQRGGRVGIAPVPPDRLPEPLPGGLKFPLVITLQTDGPSNFDQPVAVQFPNLPDPTTGKLLEPGAKSALWNFNHDTGRWEMQGTMTVSADGQFVVSDPGVGLRQPGWNGAAPGSSPVPPPPPGPPPPPDPTPCPPESGVGPVVDVVLDVAKCAADLLRLGEVAQGGIDILSGISQMLQSAFSMYSAASQAQTDPTLLLRPIITSLTGQKEVVLGIVELFNTANPAAEITDALSCIASLASSGVTAQCALTCRSQDPDCVDLMNLFKSIEFAVSAIDSIATGTIAFEPVCLGLDLLAGLLPQPTALSPQANGPGGPSLATTPQQWLDVIVPLQAELLNFQTEVSNRVAWGNVVLERLPQIVEQSSRLAWEQGAFIGASVLVEGSDGSLFRSTVPFDGVLPLPVAAAGVNYAVFVYHPFTQRNAYCEYVGAVVGTPFSVPAPVPGSLPGSRDPADADQDGLPNFAERVVGSNAQLADTDDDGVQDLVELQQGTNPLLKENASLRPIVSIDTPGDARDVAVVGHLGLIADGPAGLGVYDLSNVTTPLFISRLDTPGEAYGVAGEGNRCAVADGLNGVAVIDLSSPSSPTILAQHSFFPSDSTSIAVHDGFAYAGVRASGVAVIDLPTGELVQVTPIGDDVDNLTIAGNRLYVLGRSRLEIRELLTGGLRKLGEFPLPFSWRTVPGRTPPRALSVLDNLVYIGHFGGFSVIDVANPESPRLVGEPPFTQAAVSDIKPAAGNILLTITSFAGPATLALTTYDWSQPSNTTAFIATRSVGGEPHALVEHQGHALIAKGPEGLQVAQFFLPEVDDEVLVSFALTIPARLNSGVNHRLRPVFGAQRRVAQAELLVDGVVVASSSSWPFELSWTPPITPTSRPVSVVARVTGFTGVVSSNGPAQVTLDPPPTVPVVLRQYPPHGSSNSVVAHIDLLFDQPLNSQALSVTGATLTYWGNDGVPGTGDDQQFSPSELRLLPGGRLLRASGFGALPAGSFELSLAPAILVGTNGQPSSAEVRTQFIRVQPTPTLVWNTDQSGDWFDAANWSPARLPEPTDIVLIDRPTANPTITISDLNGSVSIAALVCRERLQVSGGDLLAAGPHQSELSGEVLTSGAATFRAGRGALLAIPGLVQGSGRFIAGLGGRFALDPSPGVIELPNYLAATAGTAVSFEANADSWINAPRLEGSENWSLFTKAFSGQVSLGSLGPDLTQRVSLQAEARGSILVPSLRSLNGISARDSSFTTLTGGRLETPSLETVRFVNIFVNDSSSAWKAANLNQFGDGELQFTGGTHALRMTTLSNSLFSAQGGARVTFERLSVCAGLGFPALNAREASVLEFPVLRELHGPISGIFPASLTVRADSGAVVRMPALDQSPTGRVIFVAEGSNSVVSLNGIRRMDGAASGTPGSLETQNGGLIELPLLERIENTGIVLRESGRLSTGSTPLDIFRAEVSIGSNAILTANELRVQTNGIVSGTGRLVGSLVNRGIIRPAGATTAGALTIEGAYTQAPTGKLELDVRGTGQTQFDALIIGGSATLDGTLAVVRSGGLNFASGQRYEVMRFASRSGDFSASTGLDQGAINLQRIYSNTVLELVAP